jgi:hypothetical protein
VAAETRTPPDVFRQLREPSGGLRLLVCKFSRPAPVDRQLADTELAPEPGRPARHGRREMCRRPRPPPVALGLLASSDSPHQLVLAVLELVSGSSRISWPAPRCSSCSRRCPR